MFVTLPNVMLAQDDMFFITSDDTLCQIKYVSYVHNDVVYM